MMRILFVARYRDATMHRKVEHLARMPDISLRYIVPLVWQDDLLRVEQSSIDATEFQKHAVAMLGSPADPHRAFYRTLSFGIRSFRPHIIHAEEEPDSLAALQLVLARRIFAPKAKLLLHTWQNLDRPMSLPVRCVLHKTLQAADAIFCANQEAAELLRRRGYCRATPIIPAVGVDMATFTLRTRPEHDRFYLGYVGRLVSEKGIDTLINAVAQLSGKDRSIHLKIVGSGPQETALRQQVERLNLQAQVTFIPSLLPAQVVGQLAELDVLVLPSRTTPVWKEQLGRVLLEAMAVGVPVIGSDSGAIPEVIGDAGLIFAEGDVTSLAERLLWLRHNPNRIAELARKGRERVEIHYSQKVLATRTAMFYRQMVV